MLMNYPSIREENSPYYSKHDTWNMLNSYIDAHRQMLIYEYPGDVVQGITISQYQCANMNFADNIRYNILFQKVVHKRGESEINFKR